MGPAKKVVLIPHTATPFLVHSINTRINAVHALADLLFEDEKPITLVYLFQTVDVGDSQG